MEEKKESRKRKADSGAEQTLSWVISCANPSVADAMSYLHCGICLHLPWDPVQTKTACQHIYCRTCIEHALANAKQCPQDKTPLTYLDLESVTEANKAMFRTLSAIKVNCPLYAEEGCRWTGDYSVMKSHVESSCEIYRIKCPHCKEIMERRQLEKHMIDCPWRPLDCSLCKERVPSSKMEHHLSVECPAFPTTCDASESAYEGKGCGVKLSRGELSLHQKTQCPRRLMACTYARYGCSFRGRTEEHGDHNKSQVVQHLELMSKELVEWRCGTAEEKKKSASFYMFWGSRSGAIYDCKHNRWTSLGEPEVRTHDSAAVAVGNVVYMVGGTANPRGMTCYDPGLNSWTDGPPLSVMRKGHSLVRSGKESIMAIGGYGSGIMSSCEELASHGGWLSRPPMSVPREYAMSVSFEGKVYVFGGCDKMVSNVPEILSSCECYDSATKEWRTIAAMPQPRWGGSAVMLNAGVVVVIGGEGKNRVTLAEAWMYDVRIDKWEVAPPVYNSPRLHRIDGGAFFHLGVLHVIGGELESNLTADHYCLDVATTKLFEAAPCPIPCKRFAYTFG